MLANFQLTHILLLVLLVGPLGAVAQDNVDGGSETPADDVADTAAAPTEAADAPASEAESAPPKPPPKKKPGFVISVVAAAAGVGLPRNMTKETVAPIPDCGAFDACCLTGTDPNACCKEHLDGTLRACGICARAACTLRVDSCSPTDVDVQVDKYCDICFEIGGAAGAAKAQASARRAQATPVATPGNPLPKPPLSKKPRFDPDDMELPFEKARRKKLDDRYDRYDRERLDRLDRFDRDRLDRLDRNGRDRDRDRPDRRDRYDRDRNEKDRDRYDRYDRFDRYDRDRYESFDSYDRDLERYRRSREERLRDAKKDRKKPKPKPKPKPQPPHDPRKEEI